MMKEEKILKEKFGKANPFTVPEGYFDSFADKLMGQLPEPEARIIEMHAESWWHKMPLRKIAAAAAVAVVMGCGAFLAIHNETDNHAPMASTMHQHSEKGEGTSSSYGSFDEMADYTMMDNQDIYASLVAEN